VVAAAVAVVAVAAAALFGPRRRQPQQHVVGIRPGWRRPLLPVIPGIRATAVSSCINSARKTGAVGVQVVVVLLVVLLVVVLLGGSQRATCSLRPPR